MRKHLLTGALCLLFGASAVYAMSDDQRNSYLKWMQLNLPKVEQFDEWQEATGELPPDFDLLPSTNALPDPFTFFNGKPVPHTKEGWAARRSEILELFQKYELGQLPPKPSISKVEVLDETQGEGYYTRNVKIWYGPEGKASVRVSISVPVGASGEKYPVLLGTSLGGWGSMLTRRGYVSAGYAASDFMDDAAPLKDIYPDYDFSALTRRAWMASVVLDYFETVPEINMDQVAIFGYSRDGKMAAIAAALDERFAAVVAGSTGVGGYVPWRLSGERGGGESIETTTRMFPDWFIQRLRYFSGREDRLPVDANLLAALVAPRALLMEWGMNDEVANGWAQERAYDSVLEVYKLFGAEEKIGMMHVPGFHGSNDQPACVDFLDIQFGRSSKKWNYAPVFSFDFNEWFSRNGGQFRTSDYAARPKKAAKNLQAWEARKAEVAKAVSGILGKKPVTLQSSGNGGGFSFMMMRRSNPGPIEIAREGRGNPGQLAPDVPAWVIARGSAEFGWVADDNAAAASKRLRIGSESVQADLFYPAGTAEGTKLPTVIWLHGFNYPLGYMWVYRREIHPILALVKEGYAVLAYDQTGFGMRCNEFSNFYDRYPEWSRMGRMVEDLSSAVDALQKEDLVDAGNISVFGYTLGGTVALYGAALDERIGSVVSVCGFTEDEQMAKMYGLIPNLGAFAGKEETLPFGKDELVSMIAPRPVLVVQPEMDRLTDVPAVLSAMEKTAAIYKLYGAEDNFCFRVPYDVGRLSGDEQAADVEWLKSKTQKQ